MSEPAVDPAASGPAAAEAPAADPRQAFLAPGSETEAEFGRLAVGSGVLGAQALEECLKIARTMASRGFPMFLGKILVQKGHISRLSVATLMRAMAKRRGLDRLDVDTKINLVRLTDNEHQILLARARDRQLLTVEQIDECYDIQYTLEKLGIDKQLGEVFLEKGLISRSVIQDLLKELSVSAKTESMMRQAPVAPAGAPRAPAAAAPPSETLSAPAVPAAKAVPSMAEILAKLPAVEREPEEAHEEEPLLVIDLDLQQAVGARVGAQRLQNWKKARFGEIAVAKGLATKEQIDDAIYSQFRLRELGIQRRIGEILTQKNVLRHADVRRILGLQEERIGQISFSAVEESHSELDALAPEDQELCRVLLENGLASQQEIDECCFVLKSMRELGVAQPIGAVLVEKGYVDNLIVEGFYRQHQQKKEEKAEVQDDLALVGASRLKSSVLSEAYREVMERLGIKEEEPGRAKAAAGVQVRGQRVWRSARDERTLARGPVAVVAGAALFAAGCLVSGIVVASLPEEGTRPAAVSSGSSDRSESEAPGDDGVFARTMGEKGFVFQDGRWVRPGAPPPPRPSSVPIPETQQKEFARRMDEEGYVQVEGAFVLPEAYQRLKESRDRAASGELRIGGKWRPVAEAADAAPVPEPGAADGLAVELPFSELDALLAPEASITRIGVRFETRLPAGALFGLLLASQESPEKPFYASSFSTDRTGKIDVEAAPLVLSLPPGVYVVRLVYRPETQIEEVARVLPRMASLSDEVLIGTEADIARRRDERVRYLRGFHEKLSTLARELAAPPEGEPKGEKWTAGRLAVLGRVSGELLSLAASQPIAELVEPRDRLYGACQALLQNLALVAAGKPVDPKILEATDRELERVDRILSGPPGGGHSDGEEGGG